MNPIKTFLFSCFFLALFANPSSTNAQDEPVSDAQKLEYIQQFAPYVYFDKTEEYFPSTVEFAFPYLTRYKSGDSNYWLKSKESLSSPSDDLDFFSGDLRSAKIYAFWVEKARGIKEITYFIYYPYNRGKEIANTIWGNHVGDWEHLTVRLMLDCVGAPCHLRPYEVYLSQHSNGDTKAWEDVPKMKDSPIVYAARGSHAMYFTQGPHTYHHIPLLGDLTDRCSKGSVFDTSQPNKVEAYDFRAKKGLNNNAWPVWMSSDFSTAGSKPADPSSGGVYRWGNPEEGCAFGQCRLEDGPTGPISKGDVWNVNVFEK